MRFNWAWFRRRFWEFRVADGTYSRYFVSFLQFIVIVYTLGIQRWDFLQAIFATMTMFAITFFCLYIPANILIGHFYHRKSQLPTDQEIVILRNPFLWRAVPGKETLLSLPLSALQLKLTVKLYEKFGLLTLEEKKQLEQFIEVIDSLIRGEQLLEEKQ